MPISCINYFLLRDFPSYPDSSRVKYLSFKFEYGFEETIMDGFPQQLDKASASDHVGAPNLKWFPTFFRWRSLWKIDSLTAICCTQIRRKEERDF